jgi:hypothetical protein
MTLHFTTVVEPYAWNLLEKRVLFFNSTGITTPSNWREIVSMSHIPPPNGPELPRIAVVGVHGVNTNEPFQTARTMARMLLKSDPREEKYPEFREIAEHAS